MFGGKNSVPTSVGRIHVSISVSETGETVLKNMNMANDTYVNGKGVEQKLIRHGDRIELGNEHYLLPWEGCLDLVLPKFADIRHLEQVWKAHRVELTRIQIRERRFNALRSATGLLTMAAMVLGGIFGRDNTLYFCLYGAAAVISVIFFALSYRWASKVPLETSRLQEETEKQYCCPACGCLFPLQKYEQLKQLGRCGHCKAVFIS